MIKCCKCKREIVMENVRAILCFCCGKIVQVCKGCEKTISVMQMKHRNQTKNKPKIVKRTKEDNSDKVLDELISDSD